MSETYTGSVKLDLTPEMLVRMQEPPAPPEPPAEQEGSDVSICPALPTPDQPTDVPPAEIADERTDDWSITHP